MPDIPIVPMIEDRRKFLAGVNSVLSLEDHSSFVRLFKCSRAFAMAVQVYLTV